MKLLNYNKKHSSSKGHTNTFHSSFTQSKNHFLKKALTQRSWKTVLSLQYRWTSVHPPFKLTAWCKSMQVNILPDFTEIAMHVVRGQHTPKILSFPCLCERQILPPHPLWFGDGNVFLFQADVEYHTGHIGLLIQQPLIIMEHKKN